MTAPLTVRHKVRSAVLAVKESAHLGRPRLQDFEGGAVVAAEERPRSGQQAVAPTRVEARPPRSMIGPCSRRVIAQLPTLGAPQRAAVMSTSAVMSVESMALAASIAPTS